MALSAIFSQPPQLPLTVVGLRARKKARTEQSIVDAAMRLFGRKGFAVTTVDEIAAAAGIGRRTFFRYFPTKEDIVLDPRRLDRAFARAALRERPRTMDDVAHVMGVLAEVQRRGFGVFRPEHQRVLHRLSHDENALAARSFVLMQDMRDLIVDSLLPKRASLSTRLRARLLAMACIVAVDTSVTMWVEGGMKEDLGAILEEAGARLSAGFAA
ncbi:MAG TPA: TetR family transcriptional regulator [Gemmatimonadaceae bacterium]|jgi:AcrR family transcriptional regulator|nr:TetR family transcriptional regulator [Gemmatimonadaceae bacterium]